jgi:chromosome segregation ATPase
MTADEAARLLADAIRDLSVARAERDEALADAATLRTTVKAALDELHRLTRDLESRDRALEHLREELRGQRERAARGRTAA